MNFLEIITDIPVLIVLGLFVFSIVYCGINYVKTFRNLQIIIDFISDFKKSDLNFRFKEMDEWMMSNPYVTSIWVEFKNTLVFSESVPLQKEGDLQYQDVSSTVQNVQTTVDSLYFFNEETYRCIITIIYTYRS